MKILQLVNRFSFPPIDGSTIGMWTLIENFASFGVSVQVLTLNTKKHYVDYDSVKNDIPFGIKIHPIDIDTDISYFKALRNLVFSNEPYIAIRFYSKKFEQKLADLLQSEKFDIVQIEMPYLGYYIPTVRANSDALISMRIHNIESRIWERIAANEANFFKRKYLQNLAKRINNLEFRILSQSDMFVSVTQIDGDYFLQNGVSKPLFVAPTGVHKKTINPNKINHKHIKFFFIGALDWQPNIQGLFWFLKNIWGKFLELHPKQIFHIAGRHASAKLAEELRQFPNVNFIGEVKDASEFERSNSVMIVPLLSGSGMRIKIVEGMSAGCAVISTSIGAEGIAVTDGENIIIADTVAEFIEQMSNITVEKANKIGNSAIKFIEENYVSEKIAKSLLEFYEAKCNI